MRMESFISALSNKAPRTGHNGLGREFGQRWEGQGQGLVGQEGLADEWPVE